MQETKTMSNNQLLEFIYQQLPRYYDDQGERDLILNRLRKQILYGEPIQERLKSLHFQTKRYSEEQQFLFYITYLQLIYTNRPFIHHAERADGNKRPNEKLIATLKKPDPDYDFREVGVQFLLAHEQYIRIKGETKNDREFLERYNGFLIYMHHQLEEALETKGANDLTKEQIELQKSCFQTAGSISEQADPAQYQGEEELLQKRMKILYASYSDEELLKMIPGQLLCYHRFPLGIFLLKNQPEWVYSYLYDLIFFIRGFLNLSEYCLRRIYQNPDMPVQTKESFQQQLSKEKTGASLIAKWIDLTIFKKDYMLLAFAARVLLQQEKRDLQYERVVLDALLKESEKEEAGWEQTETKPVYLDKETIQNTPPRRLFDLMIYDEEKREKQKTSNAKNSIRLQIETTIQVLERLRKQYGIVSETRNSQYVGAMYEELYLYTEDGLKHKQYKNIAKDIVKAADTKTKLSLRILVLLREKQLRGLFRLQNRMKEYRDYIKQRKQFLDEMIEQYASFEDSKDG